MQLNSPKTSGRGVSLPIAVGLVLLLMTASAAVNQLVIRTLRSVHQIEASNRAYLVAEAGIEEALYELSAHFAGYETASIGNPCANPPEGDTNYQENFGSGNNVCWKNNWGIFSHSPNAECAGDATLCGRINRRQKLNISLFNDRGESIETMAVSALSIGFKVPASLVLDNDAAFNTGLIIDNDGDAWVNTWLNGINEDADGPAPAEAPVCRLSASSNDDDCDGKYDEDSAEDPVIYWKILDENGNSLVPKKGCPTDGGGGSELCEKDFFRNGDDVSVTLNESAMGVREDGITHQSIGGFLNGRAFENPNGKLQMEFLVIAPLEQVDRFTRRKIPIPYLEYDVTYDAGGEVIPNPFFTIQSDGWYRDFKQSITTTVTPKTTVPLFDFTIIQQQ